MQKARQNVGPFTFYRETDSQHRQSLRRLTDRKEKGRDKTRNETVPGPEGNGTSSTKNFITETGHSGKRDERARTQPIGCIVPADNLIPAQPG